MSPKYRLVVPTLDRPQNMAMILGLFPEATVTVNKSNMYLFNGVVPKAQLVPHPDMKLIETRNWILDHFDDDMLVCMNDDVKRMYWLAGRKIRAFRDPGVIRAVIDNTAQVAVDLDVDVFTWSLSGRADLLRPDLRPFRAVGPLSVHAWGVHGQARRERRFDPKFRGCGDVDYTMQTLLNDRIFLMDARVRFDCGTMSSGSGGQTGALTSKEIEDGRANLNDKWGRFLGGGSSASQRLARNMGKVVTWQAFSPDVSRNNPRALR